MEQNKVSVWKGMLNAGILLGLVMVLFTLLLYFTDQMFNKTLASLGYVVLIAGLFLGIRSFRNTARNGALTYGQALGAGVVMVLYTSIISGIFTYVLYTYIDADLTTRMIEFAKQAMLDKGLTDDQVEMSMKVSAFMYKPFMMSVMTLVGGVFYGTIISLILAIFLKKEPANPFDATGTEEA